eukprot:Rhum_TRINITY_DN6947_c0_g2::Rhum_TRINITY_DN6947_c0_g2_i1::g.21202::m.21202/K11323/JMJD6; histone arginine demethylase JMJD6
MPPSSQLQWQALPVYERESLSLAEFQKLAAGLQPFALRGVTWEGSEEWTGPRESLERLLVDGSVDGEAEADLMLYLDDGVDRPACSADSEPSLEDSVPLAQGLQAVRSAPAPGTGLRAAYMKYPLTSPALLGKLPFSNFYVSKEATQAEMPLLLKPGRYYSWVYVGTKGSGSKTHIDVMNSSAWLTLLSGGKKWLLLHGAEHDRAMAAAAEGGAEAGQGPNLFALYSGTERAGTAYEGLRFYEYDQEPGTALFVPSRCLHAVENTADSASLTHNFVDETNQKEWEAAVKDMVGAS